MRVLMMVISMVRKAAEAAGPAPTSASVAVKVVVRFRAIFLSDYAASRPAMGPPSPACEARAVVPMASVDFSGLSHTVSGRDQARGRPDHLAGLALRAWA